MPALTPSLKGALYVLGGAVTISFAPLFVKLDDVGPSAVAMYRLFWGGLALVIGAGLRGERLIPDRSALGLLLICALFFTLNMICWHMSIIFVGPGIATILANFQVFFLAVFGALFLKERLSLLHRFSLPLALIGLWLLLEVNPAYIPAGVLHGTVFGFLAASFYSLYILCLRRSQLMEDRLPAMANIGLISLCSMVIAAFVALSAHEPMFSTSVRSNVILFIYGVGCQGLGWFLFSKGLPLLPVSRAGMIMLAQPTLAFVWDILFMGKQVGALGWCGAVLALSAICLGVLGKSKPVDTPNEPAGP